VLAQAKSAWYSAFVSSEASQIAPRPIYRAEKPVRDPRYRQFIKRLPCVACLKTWGIDPAHTGPHGITQKSCDLKCIPLCRRCHDKFDADPRGFAEREGLDIPALIARFNQFYREKIAAGAISL
jgi:hypothetical protein